MLVHKYLFLIVEQHPFEVAGPRDTLTTWHCALYRHVTCTRKFDVRRIEYIFIPMLSLFIYIYIYIYIGTLFLSFSLDKYIRQVHNIEMHDASIAYEK